MEVTLPSDCGNAPRIEIVGDFTVKWAEKASTAVSERLAEDATWAIAGGAIHNGPEAAHKMTPPFTPERVVINSIITHGRLASCDGHLEMGDKRIDFSHVFRFKSTSKTAKIAEIRSYYLDS